MDFTGLEGIGERGNATQFHAWVTNPFQSICSSRLILRSLRSSAESASRLSAKEIQMGEWRRGTDHTNNGQDRTCVLIRSHPSDVSCWNSVKGRRIQVNYWEIFLMRCNLQSHDSRLTRRMSKTECMTHKEAVSRHS